MILPNIPWTSFCKDIILWKLWCWKPTKQSGPIFYLWLNEVLANERRLYMCHIFSHWLRPWSAIHKQQAKISLVTDVGTRESTRKIWVVNIWLSHVFLWNWENYNIPDVIIISNNTECVWVRSPNCDCLVTWFCYQLIAKPGNKTATVSWPDPSAKIFTRFSSILLVYCGSVSSS